MSCSACQSTSLRTFLFSSLLLFGLLCILFTYMSDFKYPNFGIYMKKGRQFCPTFLCAEREQTQDPNNNSSAELHINPQPSDTQKIQAAAVDAEPDTIVLIWKFPFGQKHDMNCSIFNIVKCRLTADKTLYPKAHGVLFHHRDLGGMPTEPRPYFQKWVWFNMESPAHTTPNPKLNDVFNLTCNYRLNSNIPVPYGSLVPVMSQDKSFKLPAKDKLVCWIVSNWNPGSKRVQFYNELKKHINIHTYGRAFGHRPSDEGYIEIVSSCKFYLSFENSIYKDYITEKVYRPMMLGTVPVALGPQRQNYEDHITPDSFIHVDDFSTPKELAEQLLYLDQNHTEYMRYFSWTSRYKVKSTKFGSEHACQTCKYLQNHKEYQVVRNLNEWFWG
ncbi:4-galactosyl-N-acetylglucosaminide 3-alpha-L-fucosyltransferase 9-like [Sebastes umbrosus]|uniref:4-galactosyl-N-acetylglucosaminide 3-alpha-L-fucosyltransferase 9-like n=1 Tax=Sebastes umbrosus TaxID=72105 RepID=UPI00189FE01E|nr:4-galactosyl-N-acetylglucosaminide 3-alpha-L-fucosyltransferase 9-like [Sebastes umbrosus]